MKNRTRSFRTSSVIVRLAAVAGFILPPVAGAAPMAGDARPNVVFILADDLGWCDVGAYHRLVNGTTNAVPTPNLDRLAAQGMLFTDAHLPAALCAPNRFALLTGSNPYRSRPAGTWNRTATSGLDFGPVENARSLNPHRTVGEVAKAAGYRTAFFGKMHFGGDFYDSSGAVVRDATTVAELASIDYARAFENGLCDHGFDYTFVTPDGIQGPVYAYFENDKWAGISTFAGAGQIPGVTVGGASTMKVWLATDTLGNGEFEQDGYGDSEFDTSEHGPIHAYKARQFIDDHLANHPGEPFLLYYATPAIHVPLTPSAAGYVADGSTGTGPRGDFVADLDAQVGLILDKLDAAGIANNTLVVFTSDNGGSYKANDGMALAGQRPNGPLRGNKGSIYEGGHRVPFIWKWGDGTAGGSVIPPGRVCGQLVSVIDWVASLVDLTGGMIANDQHYDSASLLPLLFSDNPDAEAPVHTYLYANTRMTDNLEGVQIADADGRWFYVRYSSGIQTQELYHLDTDFGQATNLLAGYATPASLPAGHPQKTRVTDANAWFAGHSAYDDARTAPSRDYRGPAAPTNWVRFGDFEGAPDAIGAPDNAQAWNAWKVTGEDNTFNIQVREITPPDNGNLLPDPNAAGLAGAHSGQKALLYQYYYDGATIYQDLDGFTFNTNLSYTLTAWIAPYDSHASNTDDDLIVRVRSLESTNRPVVKSTTVNLNTLAPDAWTPVTLTVTPADLAGRGGFTPRIEFAAADAHKWRVAIDDVSFTPSDPAPATLRKTPIPINVPSPALTAGIAGGACTVSWTGARVGASFMLQKTGNLPAGWTDRLEFDATSQEGAWPDPDGLLPPAAFYRLESPGRFYRYDLPP